MIQLRKYFTPILIVMLVLLVAGCSSSGGDGGDVNPIDDPGTIDDPTFPNLGDGWGDPVDGEEEKPGSVEEELDDKGKGKHIGGIDAPLRLSTVHHKKFDNAKYGVEYDCNTTMKATGGVGEYRWGVTGLPRGMEFDSEKRRLRGAPEEVGIFTVLFTVTDEDGETGTKDISLAVQDEYTIELLYKFQAIDEALAGLDDGMIPFDFRHMTVVVRDGYAKGYDWKVLIDGEVATVTETEDPMIITFELPADKPGEVKKFEVEVSVEDEPGRGQAKEYTLERGRNPCTVPLEIEEGTYGGGAFNGKKLLVKGGKAPYIWDVEMESTAKLTDFKGKPLADGVKVRATDFTKGSYSMLSNVASALAKGVINIGKEQGKNGDYSVAVHKLPKISGVGGYEILGKATVKDSCDQTSDAMTFSIKKTQSMDSLKDLRMICDFEDIHDAGGYNAYIAFDFYTNDGAMARVHYDLEGCNGYETSCEGKRVLKPLREGKNEEDKKILRLCEVERYASLDYYDKICEDKESDLEAEFYDLSQIELSEVNNIKLWKHKTRNGRGVGSGDIGKLDVDLQWCRFYTEDNKWFAIWDDQKNGDDLNDNEVGGNMHWYKNKFVLNDFIIDRFEGYKEHDSIWFMGEMLKSFAIGSEDGFDYIKPRDNDGKD
jgi:Putative Ig domain